MTQNHCKLYFHLFIYLFIYLFSGLALLEIVLGGEKLRTGNCKHNRLMNSILLIRL